jgi:Predicted nucleic acid-binding protein, contains PIN domain
MMSVVLDASVTMTWCFEDKASDATEALLDRVATEHAVVPGLWRLEVANVLLGAERRKRISESQGRRFVELLVQLPIRVDDTPTAMGEIVAMARRHGLTAYDAEYLMSAERLGLPLATLDRRLADAAREAGVALALE